MRFVGYEREVSTGEAGTPMKHLPLRAFAVWVLLPASMGSALDALLDGWSRPPATVAVVFAFAGWFAGLLALSIPRPRAFTALRIVAPTATAIGIAGLVRADPVNALHVVAAAHGLLAVWVTLSADVAVRSTDGASYGNEQRVPLQLPPQFAFVLVPGAVAFTSAGLVAGPTLLADRRWVVGAVVTVVGFVAAAVALRSLVGLERRFVVLVPAGLVISDSLVLVDPILFTREHVRSIHPDDTTPPGVPRHQPGALDLRLGARRALALVADEPALIPCRNGREGIDAVSAARVLFAPLRREELLAVWNSRA